VIQSDDIFSEPPEALQQMLADSSTMIHAAWYVEPGKYLDSALNLDCLAGTLRLARAFAAAGGRRFVGVGTCAEYDLSEGVLRTDSPLAPVTLYATCKASAYQVLSRFFTAEKVSFAWCRLFYLYGEGEDERRLVPYIRTQLAAGEEALLTSGEQIRDFIDVQEAGRMIADVALGKRDGPVNLCSGRPVTVRQLAERIAAEYGRPDLLRFGARPDNAFDPPLVVGVCEVDDD
jgi:dTDP-6-deoxy-L-talose 4-dehydrogenase (NAD+)